MNLSQKRLHNGAVDGRRRSPGPWDEICPARHTRKHINHAHQPWDERVLAPGNRERELGTLVGTFNAHIPRLSSPELSCPLVPGRRARAVLSAVENALLQDLPHIRY